MFPRIVQAEAGYIPVCFGMARALGQVCRETSRARIENSDPLRPIIYIFTDDTIQVEGWVCTIDSFN